MAFLSITPLKPDYKNFTSFINTKYEKYLNETHVKYNLSYDTALYVESEGFPEHKYYTFFNEKSCMFNFGVPVFEQNQKSDAKPIAGVYCFIKNNHNKIIFEADALGYYPVFYLLTEEIIIISDRQECIAALFNKNLRLNKNAIIEFSIAELINGNNSFFEGINRLAIDQVIFINREGAKIEQKTHFLYKEVKTLELLDSYKEIIRGIEAKYNYAEIKLSGGYDSRLNLCLLLKFGSIPKYCITLPTDSFDIKIASKITSHYKLEHYVLNNESAKKVYQNNHYGHNNVTLTGQCGELSRSFYYNALKRQDDLNGFLNQYLPFSKKFFLNAEHKDIIISSVLDEIESLKKKSNTNNELYRIFDWIYLNRARTTFGFQVTNLKLSLFQFPLLVNEYWFRHRLSFTFDQIQSKKNYHQVFQSFDSYLGKLPYKPFSVFRSNNYILQLNKIIRLYSKSFQKDITVEDSLGIFPKQTSILINTQSNIKKNYSMVIAAINYVKAYK